MRLGMRRAPIGRVEVERRRQCGTGERPVVADIGPQSPGPGLADIEDRHRRVIGMDALGGEDMLADRLDQRHQRRRCRAHPISQRRDVELYAFAGEGRALPGQRQVQSVLAEQHVRQQRGTGTAARDGVRRRRRLGDLLAASA